MQHHLEISKQPTSRLHNSKQQKCSWHNFKKLASVMHGLQGDDLSWARLARADLRRARLKFAKLEVADGSNLHGSKEPSSPRQSSEVPTSAKLSEATGGCHSKEPS